MERYIILSRLLDKYERSRHLLKPGTSNRRVMLRVEKKELPEYRYQEAAVRDAFNQAARALEREGFISVEWIKGRPVLSAVILRLDAVGRCYQLTGRVHPREQAERVAEAVQNALAHVETPWITAWRDDVCTRARSTYAIPQFCRKDAGLLPKLLIAMAQYDALRGEPVTMRVFSGRCFQNSKTFEREVREIFLHIAETYHAGLAEACEHTEMGVRDQLAFLGIYARPELYELSGRITLVTPAGTVNVGGAYPYGIAIPSTAVDTITDINLNDVHRVIFLENKTNYDEFLLSESDLSTLAIYHGGFLSPQKRKLFAKIAEALPENAQVFFWADIDLGGFQMFSHLQALFPGLLPLRMDGAAVATHWRSGLPRSKKYLDRLRLALENREYPLFDDAIRKILEYGVTIEQETLLR